MKGARLAIAGTIALLLVAGFIALGSWQLRRLAWKRALIASVAARVRAAPVSAPGPRAWAVSDVARAQYLRVTVAGRFLPVPPALVQASTARGAGWWVMAPVRTDAGFTLLVNRGFVPARVPSPPPRGPVVLTGLLRVSEPDGGFLRANDPAHDRWYSRDVAAIASARRIGAVAPYFVDADAASTRPGGPVGGLTVVRFPNDHLAYALTWYGLAAMTMLGFLIVLRVERRRAR